MVAVVFVEWFSSTFARVAIALITLLLGFLAGKILGRLAKRILKEAEANRILRRAGLRIAFDHLAGQIVKWLVYVATVLMVLKQLGLAKIVFGILAVLAGIVIIVSLVLWFRDFIPNAVSGLFLRKHLSRALKQRVRIGFVSGRLVRVGLLESVIRTPSGDELHVPHFYAAMKGIRQPG